MKRWQYSFAAITATVVASDVSRLDFAYGMRLAADGAAPLYELALPIEVYERSISPSLADLRVLNGQGAVVPYAIVRRVESGATAASALQTVPLFPLRGNVEDVARGLKLRIQSAAGSIDLNSLATRNVRERLGGYLLDLRALKRPIVALEVEWPAGVREFSDLVRIDASDDLIHWQSVAEGPLVNLRFNGQSLRRQRLDFAAHWAGYWRVLWPSEREAVALNAARVQPAAAILPLHRLERVQVAVAVANAPREYAVDLAAHLPVDRINIRLPERNTVAQVTLSSRAHAQDQWRVVTSGTFFRLAQSGSSDLANDALAIAENRDRYWKIEVSAAGGGIGAGTPALVAGWIPETLQFIARGNAPYELVFGSALARAAEMPLSAMTTGASIGASVNAAGADKITATPTTAGAIADVGGASKLVPPPPPLAWRTWLLWAVLGAGVLLLAYFAWKLTRELGPGGS